MRQDLKHALGEGIEAIAVYLVIVGLLMVFMTIVLAGFRNGMTASTKNPHIAMYCKSVTESSAAPASQNTTAAP